MRGFVIELSLFSYSASVVIIRAAISIRLYYFIVTSLSLKVSAAFSIIPIMTDNLQILSTGSAASIH